MPSKTFTLGQHLQFESGERSDRDNWIKQAIVQAGFPVMGFEGYTIERDRVSLLLDRANFIGHPRAWHENDVAQALREHYGALVYDLKLDFAERLGVPWLFVAYAYAPKNPRGRVNQIHVLRLHRDQARLERSFSRSSAFAGWLANYRSLAMHARYEESGLPAFDRELRRFGSPWPGNLDGLLACPRQKSLVALIEFQNTSKTTVRAHCNNRWFLPRGRRKGDQQRWKALDIIRLQAALPLLVLVWSRKENEVKLKVVADIVYSNDPEQRAPGLRYSFKQVMDWPHLKAMLHKRCAFPEVSGDA